MQKTRTSLIAAAAVAGIVAVAGCGSSSVKSAPTTAGSASSTTAAPTPSSSAAPTSAPTSPSSGGAATTTTVPVIAVPTTASDACTTGQLSASLSDGSGAAGTFSFVLSLTNNGSSACYVDGFPGVSQVAGSTGSQVGASAVRSNQSFAPVRIGPTGSAQAVLYVHDAANYPASTCMLTATRGFRVYPPGQTGALFVAQTGQGCANAGIKLLTIDPMVPGPEDPQS